jgi:hypothetical protein
MSQREEAAMFPKVAAVLLTGLAMVAPGAHLFELFRKMRLPEDKYFVVQEIYRGWWIVGLLLPAALIASIALAVTVGGSTARWLAAAAAALLAFNLAIFAIWTQPVNSMTSDWSEHVADWEMLRRQWEYSHAANAGITFAAFCAVTLAALYAD